MRLLSNRLPILHRTLVILVFPNLIFAQTKGNISFGFEYSNVFSKMDMVDSYLADTSLFSSSFYDKPQTNTLSNTNGIGFEIGFQPTTFQDIAIGLNYQFSYINRTPRIQYADPVFPDQNIDYKGKYTLFNDAISLNLMSRTYFSNLLDFKNKKSDFLKKMIIASELGFGLGFSKLKSEIGFEYPTPTYLKQHNRAALASRMELALIVGYKLKDRLIISSLNFKIAYQYYKSQSLKNKADEVYNIDFSGESKPICLDFSGMSLGVVLMLRK
jgi:hypothetical protein